MYVCMYVCMHVSKMWHIFDLSKMCVYTHTHAHAHTHTLSLTHTHTHISSERGLGSRVDAEKRVRWKKKGDERGEVMLPHRGA